MRNLTKRRPPCGWASGQYLILTETPFGPKGYPMSRLIPGPHLGFYVAPEQWKDALAQLDRLSSMETGEKRPKAGRPAEAKELTWMIRRDM
jgi:hypothetical protein